ncbi:LysR family transcriptional regulator [Solihabitans fulvus]|uniref:LysR family transcriptional regulator n=1 Tax=Solihabitans fulvus TaxID=1892852 RepID=A0A5B2XJ28_9PSEU|nr:LysR substrate-binding domain-containing protein [Solihabitans fulvus]KAA2263413.1 LysR family transcriptional regulator [Solihabitans fulvus]
MTTNARLRAFVEVADTGSVRAAAERLYITESAVSAAIISLVKEVGVPLLERDGRGVRLTPAGVLYAQYARTILGLHEQAEAAARDQARPDEGLIRIAAVTTAGEHVLPTLLASFRARHARIQLRLEVAPKDRVWPMLNHHEVDLVVAGRPPDGFRARVRAIRPNTLVVVGTPAVAAEFAPEHATWLLREHGSGTRATCLAVLGTLDVEPAQLTLGSNGAVVAGSVAGLGVALVSREAVAAQLAAGHLVELPVPGTPLDRPWHAVTQADSTAATELLIHHLLNHNGGGWRTTSP